MRHAVESRTWSLLTRALASGWLSLMRDRDRDRDRDDERRRRRKRRRRKKRPCPDR